jgi:phosphohistidine phosphatase
VSDRADRVRLHLLRHADAGDPERWQGDDAARPLSSKGIAQAERLGRHLAALGFRPGAILSSPKVRAHTTATIVAAALGAEVRSDERLGGSVDFGGLHQILADAGWPDRPVLVGHDPDFSQLLDALTGADGLEMKKGALARVDIDRELTPRTGRLRWLLPPDLLAGED